MFSPARFIGQQTAEGMRRLITYLTVGVVAQVACIAVGLWMHDRFLLSTAGRTAEEKAAAELIAAAEPLVVTGRKLRRESVPAELSRQIQSTPRRPASAFSSSAPTGEYNRPFHPRAKRPPPPVTASPGQRIR
jgi:hypothetical protein